MKLTIEYFQNPSDLAVHEKTFISRGFKMNKNLSSQSDNFSKTKNTLKNFKKLFLHFSKYKFCFFLYMFEKSKYFLIFPVVFINDRIHLFWKINYEIYKNNKHNLFLHFKIENFTCYHKISDWYFLKNKLSIHNFWI